MKTDPTYRFNQKADAELIRVYEEAKAQSISERINALNVILGGPSNYTGFGGTGLNKAITNDQKLGCLEHEYLGNIGLIELHLA